MGDLDDAAALLKDAASYLNPAEVAAQAAAVEMVITRLLRVSETNPTIQNEISGLTVLEEDLKKASTQLHYRKIRLGVMAGNIGKGSAP